MAGWLEHQLAQASKDVAGWPDWKRKAAGLPRKEPTIMAGEITTKVNSLLLRCDAADLAYQTVQQVMDAAENGGHHTASTWTREGDHHHLVHAQDHLRYDPTREDLEHALCRLAMALWSLDHQVLGDFGPEGINAKV